jgi:hypothetical protein
MATKRVRCRSGCVGWQDRLRNVYDNDMEQFLAYTAIYGIHGRLGYDSPEAAWDENLLIQGSTEPSDLRKAKP